MSKIILVSNRLPVKMDQNGQPVRTTGGLASALQAIESDDEKVWVGWSGEPEEEIENKDALTNQLRNLKIEPVYLDEETVEGFYEGYSNGTLWPLLHYMSQRASFDVSWADAYRRANEKFAEAVLRVAEDGDLVWIHDYHLFLLPALLRKANSNLRIGFFLHTPFPSSAIFRIIPERDELLLGLLGADFIGFHTFNYLRHFRSSLLNILGLEADHDSLYHDGHRPRFGVYPIGHDARGFRKAMETEDYRIAQDGLLKSLSGRKLALNVERLDYTKGVPQKLAAIRHFLENYPEKRNDVIFVIIAVPSRQNVEEYVELTESVQREIGAINGDYGTVGHTPVTFFHRGFPPEELASFYSQADICMVTPLIDGMNLVAKEFIDCKRQQFNARPGVLILSEFAGAAAEMSHAIMVNPYAVDQVSSAIDQALDLSDEEMWSRVRAMQDRLNTNDAGTWANRFIEQFRDDARKLSCLPSTDLSGVIEDIGAAVDAGENTMLFLDYDGTLRGFVNRPEDAVPDPDLIPLLKRLNEKAKVAIVSGRPKDFLEQHFGDTGFSLVAEHGYRWSLPQNKDWELVNPLVDTQWKANILPLLEQAVHLTPGTHIEEKPSAVVWHYRAADKEFGLWQAHRLLSELTDITAGLSVAVHHGKKIVEVSSLQVSKGAAVDLLVQKNRIGAGMAAGDDQTDESMFELENTPKTFHTIHVGGNDTRAANVSNIEDFRSFLVNLAERLHR